MSLEVVRALGLATVQDLGRVGHMHEAVPPGGALVPELLVAANRGAGNLAAAAGIEVMGQLVLRARGEVTIAIDDSEPRTLRAGDEVMIASGARRCSYLAVRGGVDAPLVLGGRGTLTSAGLGAPLRVGDTIAPGSAAGGMAIVESFGDVASVTAIVEPFVDADTIGLIAGPDHDAFTSTALDVLTSAPYRILPSSDRVGTRLAGPAIPRNPHYRERSRPMVRGALEIPSDARPIVLGPEHPTTGGYPIVAVIASAELGRFFAIRLGGSVQFYRR